MKKQRFSESGVFNVRTLFAFALCSTGTLLAMFSFAATFPVNTSATSSLAPATGSWSIVNSPNTDPSQSNQLNGVTCVSASDCWAVGNYFGGTYYHTLVEHWDGNAWTITPSPNASETAFNNFYAVACTSASDCWTVGYGTSFETLIEHWDGSSWSIVPSPNVTAVQNILTGLACTSASDCWAVGYYRAGPNAAGIYNYPSLIEHWDGNAWTVAPAPATGWNEDELYQVTCTSSSNCWAVGYTSGPDPLGPFQTLIEQWDGVSWEIVTSPNTTPANNNYLFAVSCNSATDCRAAGYSNTPEAGNATTLVTHWNGTSWTIDSTPNIDISGNNAFFGIACASSATCWGAGYYNGSNAIQTLIERWDGNSWTISRSSNTSAAEANVLNFVTCSSAYDCWTVGYSQDSSSVSHNLIEHYTVPAVQLVEAVSRKVHGSAGVFDIVLRGQDPPPPGYLGIECRSGGVNGDYTLVFTFANNLTSVGGASVSSGTGSVSNAAIGSDFHQYLVNLTGVTNAQTITVGLSNVSDSAGNFSPAVAGQMGVLLGDVNASGRVDAADVSLVRQQTLQNVDGSNFREDINASGRIDAADVSIARRQTLTSLP